MTDTTAETTEAQGTGTPAEGTENSADAKNAGLAGLKMAQLQALASQLGITGGSRMRKQQLVEAISSHQRGGAVAERQEKAKQAEKQTEKQADASGDAAPDGHGSEGSDQQKSRRGGKGRGQDKSQDQSQNQDKDQSQGGQEQAGQQDGGSGDQQSSRGGSGSKGQNQQGQQQKGQQDGQKGQNQQGQQDGQKGGNKHRRNRGRGDDQNDAGQQKNDGGGQQNQQGQKGDGGRGGRNGSGQNNGQNSGQNSGQNNAPKNGPKNDGGGRGNDDDGRRSRRNRNRNDRGNRRKGRSNPEVDDTELTDDDVLLPVAGILDVLDNYAFVRTSGYLPGQNDVYVSLNQVKRHHLRKGDAVHGYIRAPRDGESNSGKNKKFNPLVKLESVNGRPADQNDGRVDFGKLVPLYPQERLRLENDPKEVGNRVIDLVSPIGKGQRGLIVSPPKAGKTLILQALARAIKANNPEVHLMMVLVDERPEEVTDMQRTVDGEVIASTFDRPADDHTTVAELAIERAKRLVEMGKDVVVLLDSMTRLGRAYNTAAPASGRILSGGVDANALYPPKRFFGAARNIENGGSLTILATALVETGSRMDEVIFEEFKGTGNMELRLSRHLADRRIFPAVDVNASSTRREENLLSPEEIKIMWKLRRVLSGLEQQQGLELLINKLKETKSNAEFLLLANKTTLGDKKD
ncbi:hypothetical protein GCM10027060_26070 [Nesterenkonia halophila]